MLSRSRTLFVSFVLALSVPAGVPSAASDQATPASADSLPPGAEFPPSDISILSAQWRGLQAKLASLRLAQAPDAPETVSMLIEQERLADALRSLRVIVETRPERMARTFELLAPQTHRFLSDPPRRYGESLRQIVAAAGKRLSERPREEAARAARALGSIENWLARSGSNGRQKALMDFVREYAGTEAAVLAEVDLLGFDNDMPRRIEARDRYAREHPGTIAAAKALYSKGADLANNGMFAGIEPRRGDPLRRFLMVRDIVAELESGRYPRCEWVDKAPELMIQFSAYEPTYAPGSIDRLITEYQKFVTAHFTGGAGTDPANNGVGYVVTSKITKLFELNGEGVSGTERVFSDLERETGDPAGARYLRAAFYMKRMRENPAARPAMLEKARDTLTALHAQDNGFYGRKALATLASLYFNERDHSRARDAYRTYLKSFPGTDWAWVAALRLGQCEEGLGDARAAVAAYQAAAAAYPSNPLARVLGHAYAARGYEADGQFDRALVEFQRALDGWDNDYGLTYSLYVPRAPNPDDPFALVKDEVEVTKQSLPARISQVKQSLSLPGGVQLERGRWLLTKGRLQEAQTVLSELIAAHPRSAAGLEARRLGHRARLEQALELASIENLAADEPAAIRELEALARESYDFAVFAAGIVRASLLWKQGVAADAQAVMTETLKGWLQKPSSSMILPSRLATDVAEIREIVFRPNGDGVFAADSSRWNAFSWPAAPPPFFIVDPDVSVKLANGEIERVQVYRNMPGRERVLFVTSEELDFFNSVINKLGGTKKRRPSAIMETPNQPVGRSLDILAFWNEFFPARPGHWSGWVFETYPIIERIEFLDAERTKAAVSVTVGYSGATVVVDKTEGKWVARELVNFWVT
jgi:tetratricopeptide (TPR) repeat protein